MRFAVIAAAAAVGAIALTGCEKPSPGVTVWSGTASEYEHALCWSFEPGAGIDDIACAEAVAARASSDESFPQVEVVGGNTIGISVDPVVAENGWIPAVGGQDLVEQPLTVTYWRFTLPDLQPLPESGFPLEIRAFGEEDSLRGLWTFEMVPR